MEIGRKRPNSGLGGGGRSLPDARSPSGKPLPANGSGRRILRAGAQTVQSGPIVRAAEFETGSRGSQNGPGPDDARRIGLSAFCVVMRMGAWYPCCMSNKPQQQYSARLAKALAVLCVRHTCLEDLHAGKPVVSKAGDFSDVKVVTPEGEIPWNEVSRISQHEMKTLMKQVVSKLYTVLMSLENEEAMDLVFRRGHDYAHHWDDPEILPTFLKPFVPPGEESAAMSQVTSKDANRS